MNVTLTLTRRNLESLLTNLDKNRVTAGTSQCTIVKQDTQHEKHPLVGASAVWIHAVEDEDYYNADRLAGLMLTDSLDSCWRIWNERRL